jgi:hypothetical protein
MKTQIELYFLPGAAGNFFSRCLNLLNNAYCWAPADTPTAMPNTAEEKQQLLSYANIINCRKNWLDFEVELVPFQDPDQMLLPEDAIAIWIGHPGPTSMQSSHNDKFFFYIDPGNAFEWMLLNGLYKDSGFHFTYFKYGQRLRDNSNIHKIDLAKIITSRESFAEEFCRVCNIVNHQLSSSELDRVLELYDQWIQTTLTPDKISYFKQSIGWCL